jgi:hypothetical protein
VKKREKKRVKEKKERKKREKREKRKRLMLSSESELGRLIVEIKVAEALARERERQIKLKDVPVRTCLPFFFRL